MQTTKNSWRRGLAAVLLALALSVLTACDRSPLVGDDLEEAKIAIQAHNWTLAERLLERYLRMEQGVDKRWEAWQRLLDVTTSAGKDYRTALDYLEGMLQEFYEDEARTKTILLRMGELNEILRRYDRAADVWSTYVELASLTPEEAVSAHRRLAQIHIRNRRFEAGEDVLQGCMALVAPDTERAMCIYDLADSQMARERWKEASDLALQIMDMEADAKTKGLAAFLLGDALEQQNQLKDALEHFEAARGSYPNERVVENRIAFLKKKLKK